MRTITCGNRPNSNAVRTSRLSCAQPVRSGVALRGEYGDAAGSCGPDLRRQGESRGQTHEVAPRERDAVRVVRAGGQRNTVQPCPIELLAPPDEFGAMPGIGPLEKLGLADEFGDPGVLPPGCHGVEIGSFGPSCFAQLVEEFLGHRRRPKRTAVRVPLTQSTVHHLLRMARPLVGAPVHTGQMRWVAGARERADDGSEAQMPHGETDVEVCRTTADHLLPAVRVGEPDGRGGIGEQVDPGRVAKEEPGLGVVEGGRGDGRAHQVVRGMTGCVATRVVRKCRDHGSTTCPWGLRPYQRCLPTAPPSRGRTSCESGHAAHRAR